MDSSTIKEHRIYRGWIHIISGWGCAICEDHALHGEWERSNAIGLANGIGFGSTEFHVLRAKQGVCDRYIYHWCNSRDLRQAAEVQMTGSAGQKRVPADFFSRYEVQRLDLSEQRTIATILDSIDNAIHHTEQMIEKLQKVKAGLLHDLLTFGLDENGELRDPIRRPEQFKDSPLGRIPTEWEVESVNNLCFEIIDCKNRTPPITKDGHPVIRTPNVRDGLFILDNLVCTDPKSYTEWTARGKPEPGDVVITREAPYGEACIIPDDIVPPCLGQRMMMYKPDPLKLNNEFLVQMIYSQRMQRLFLGLAGGSTVGHLRVGDVRTLPIPHPKDVDEQKAIADYMIGMNAQIAIERENLSKLTRCKQGLMRDLLTGKVPIPQGIVEL